ncbi:hypothetical protein IV417_08280 [Alphaproteobacteria bacterium KMM 3653]|uniref:Uncharacterized protein n=1 Tax=Harenicola maris TaxID=2841044 RepID=A0AAP2CPL3_9RHOB|nr:hypothetical protein [Harenicola maris]
MPPRRPLPARRLIALLCTVLWAGQASAQEGFRFDPSDLGTRISGTPITVDGSLLGDPSKITSPFDIVLPTSDAGWVARMDTAPSSGLVKFVFTSPEGQFVEALSFAQAQVPAGETTRRLEQFGAAISRDLVPGLLAQDPNAAPPRIRRIGIGRLEGVELFGTYNHASEGEVLWRYVGLLDPFSRNALIALAQVSRNRVVISGPEALDRSLSGQALASVSLKN